MSKHFKSVLSYHYQTSFKKLLTPTPPPPANNGMSSLPFSSESIATLLHSVPYRARSGFSRFRESITTLPPFGPIEGPKFFLPDFKNESLRRTGLNLNLSEKSSFYLPAFEISRSFRNTASELEWFNSYFRTKYTRFFKPQICLIPVWIRIKV